MFKLTGQPPFFQLKTSSGQIVYVEMKDMRLQKGIAYFK